MDEFVDAMLLGSGKRMRALSMGGKREYGGGGGEEQTKGGRKAELEHFSESFKEDDVRSDGKRPGLHGAD
ncbi:MAG TPA: hypothetical protein VIJ38_17520 [Acidobacteriaceae bacterium]